MANYQFYDFIRIRAFLMTIYKWLHKSAFRTGDDRTSIKTFHCLRLTSWARSIQPKFQPVRPGKEDHLKRWSSFSETFPVGPNRSIEFWTEISGNFVWMDRAPWFPNHPDSSPRAKKCELLLFTTLLPVDTFVRDGGKPFFLRNLRWKSLQSSRKFWGWD